MTKVSWTALATRNLVTPTGKLKVVLQPTPIEAKPRAHGAAPLHLCLPVASASQVIYLAERLNLLGIPASAAPKAEQDLLAYRTVAEDPDGLRVEVTSAPSQRLESSAHWLATAV